MQKWEYLQIDFVGKQELKRTVGHYTIMSREFVIRPTHVNGKEIPNSELGPDIFDYFNHLGDDGWELVDIYRNEQGFVSKAVFKRAKPQS